MSAHLFGDTPIRDHRSADLYGSTTIYTQLGSLHFHSEDSSDISVISDDKYGEKFQDSEDVFRGDHSQEKLGSLPNLDHRTEDKFGCISEIRLYNYSD